MINNLFCSLAAGQFSASSIRGLFIRRIITSCSFVFFLFKKSPKSLFIFLFTRCWFIFFTYNSQWNWRRSFLVKILLSCFYWRILFFWTWRNSLLFIFFRTLMSYVIWPIIINSRKPYLFLIIYWFWLLDLRWWCFLLSWSWIWSICFFFWLFFLFFIWLIIKFIVLVNKNLMFSLFQNWSSRLLRNRLFLLRS